MTLIWTSIHRGWNSELLFRLNGKQNYYWKIDCSSSIRRLLLSITMKEEKNFYFDQKTQGTKKRFNLTLHFVYLIQNWMQNSFFWSDFVVTHSNFREVRPWWPGGIKIYNSFSVRYRICWVAPRFWILLISFSF